MRRPTTLSALIAASAMGFCAIALTTASLRAEQGAMTAAPGVTKAVAVLHATDDGPGVSGEITFTKTAEGIHVKGEVKGLKPGEHGFHIHEFGDTSSPKGMSTGGHFNPLMAPHSAPTAEKRHVGDMGNITANAKGVAMVDYVDPKMSFMGATSILGRGVVVHEKADDLKSQPAGAAGNRLATGVVGVAKPGA